MRLRKLLAAIAVASMLLGLVGATAGAQQTSLQQEFVGAYALMSQFGIMEGDVKGDPSKFRPNDSLTRAEAAKVLVAAAGQTEVANLAKGASPFKDVPSDHWASGFITVAKNAGYIRGYSETQFGPEDKVTFAQLITMMARFAKLPMPAQPKYPDDYVAAAKKANLVANIPIDQVVNEPAPRGLVLIIGNRTMQTPDETGKTPYQTKHKPTPPSVTVDKVDSPTTEKSVTIKGKATSAIGVLVAGTPKAVGADGSFSVDVPLKVGENEISVVAVDNVGNQAKATVKVTRANTNAGSIEAPATLEVKAGGTAAVQLVVKDGNGEAIEGAVVDATVDQAVGTWDAATGTLTAATKTGSGKVAWKSGDATAETTVTVKAGALAKVVVSPSKVNVATGVAQKFTARGEDANGNEVTGVTAVWSTEEGKGIIDQNGNFSATTGGTVKVTAKVGDLSGEATVTSFGTATKLAISPLSKVPANGKTQTTVTVSAQDVNGNAVNSYSGVITLRLTATTFVGFPTPAGGVDTSVSTTASAVNGVATFTLQANTAPGDTTVSASATGLTGATATLTSELQTVSSISVAADPATLGADGSSVSVLTVTLLDSGGKKIVRADITEWNGTFTSSDQGVAIVTSGIVNATANASTAVGATIVGTVTARSNIGATTISVSVKQGSDEKFTGSATVSTMLVGEPYKLIADAVTDASARQLVTNNESMSVKFRIQDVNGNQVTKLTDFTNLNLSLFANDPYYTATVAPVGSATVNTTIPLGTGVALSAANAKMENGKVTVKVASGKAQTVNFTLSGTYGAVSPTTLQKAESSGKFVPGPARNIYVTASPSDAIPGNGTTTIYAYIKDNANLDTAGTSLGATNAYRNTVTTGAYEVTYSRTAGSLTNWTGTQTVTTANGLASVTYTGGTATGTETIDARYKYDGTTPSNGTAVVTVNVIGAPYQLDITSYPDPATVPAKQAGQDHYTYVKVKDALGSVVTTDNSTVVTLTLKDASTGTTRGTFTATVVNGTATFTVSGITLADTYTATATATSLVKKTKTDYTIVPAVATKLKGVIGTTTMAAATDSTTILSLWAADQYDNTRPEALTGVTATSSNTEVATVPGNATCSSNKCTVVVTGTANTGTTTITGKKAGLDNYVTTVTTTVVGDPKSAVVVVDRGGTVAMADSADTKLQRVRVRIVDASGNRVTQSPKQKWVKLTISGTGGDGVTTYKATQGDQANTNVLLYATNKSTTNGFLYRWGQTGSGTEQPGEYTFYVNTALAGSPTYTAIIVGADADSTQTANTNSGTATGTFAATTANKVVLTVTKPSPFYGDGSSIAQIEAKVADIFGNHKATAGTLRFSVDSTSYAYLQGAASDGSLSVSTSDGKHTAVLQAQRIAGNGNVVVTVTFTPTDVSTVLATPTVTSTIALTVPPS